VNDSSRSEGRSGPGAWGIAEGYHDVSGTWHEAPQDTIRALLEAMQARDHVDDGPPAPSRPTWVVRPGAPERLLNPCDLTLEDGTVLGALEELPPDLPLGYHSPRPRVHSAIVRRSARSPIPQLARERAA
jgi:hypothetical protein